MITHLTGARRGERELFEDPVITVGRARQSRLRLGVYDTRASARHAELRLENGRYYLVDLGSTNGTYVNGRRGERHRLRSGDVVTFGYEGPQVRVEFFEALPAERPSIDEPHEFPCRFSFKWWLWGAACVFLGAAVALVIFERVVLAIPAGLAAATLFFLGLSATRVNITVGPDGIEHEGLFRTTRIPWPEIESLESKPGQTGRLHSPVCTIRGRGAMIRFAPSDYAEGHLLARLVAEGSAKEWQASREPAQPGAAPAPSSEYDEAAGPRVNPTDRLDRLP